MAKGRPTDQPDALTMVYDGDCGMCSWVADRVAAKASHVQIVPSAIFLRDHTHATPERFEQELLVISPDGDEFWGPRAALLCLRSMGHHALGWEGWLPFWHLLYPVIARNRATISRVFGLGNSCRVTK